MKRILSLLLLFALACSLFACSYPAVRSTDRERTTVLTLDGGSFSVPYEQYRFLFLSERALLEDEGTLTDAQKAERFALLNQRTLEELAVFYAVFSLAEKYGIDPEDKEFNKAVKTGVEEAVEGADGYTGYGDHETYLKKIKEAYMNDSVFRFLLRYRAVEARLAGKLRDEGVISSAKETVLSYMNSDECVRATWIYIPYTVLPNYTDADLTSKVARAKAASDEEFLKMTHEVVPDAYTDAELEVGFYMGKYQLDPYYETLTETVFSLKVGETSDLIHSGDGVYIVRRFEKDNAYLANEDNLADFTEYYLLNTFYKILNDEAERLASTASYTEFYQTLSLNGIKMDEE